VRTATTAHRSATCCGKGKVALLFDGFDELAQRTDYDRVVDHSNTLQEAAGGAAKVIVTSRHQYFATDGPDCSPTRTSPMTSSRSPPGGSTSGC
jgi:hypothetical protein